MKRTRATTMAGLEKALHQSPRYRLSLFVTGMTPRSTEALATIKRLCDQHLAGRYDLEVIDVYQNPARARDEQIVAVPTLVKQFPAPHRKIIGNLSAIDRVLMGLDIRPQLATE